MFSRESGIPFALYAYAMSALARASREKRQGLQLIRAQTQAAPDDNFIQDMNSLAEAYLLRGSPHPRRVAPHVSRSAGAGDARIASRR